MKSILLATILTASLWLPCQAAEPALNGPDTISFSEYRDWRVNFITQRQAQIGTQLAARGLAEADRDRLTREKAYYDRQAAMSAAERDHLFRARFDQIDANHDGTIDRTERAAWHDRQNARYHQEASAATTRH